MYIVIKHDSGSKQYQMTDAYDKPYISVKNVGVLPLTTNTTNGTYLKITKSASDNKSVTYRPLEYESHSDTLYTTAENSIGLSSTTALTRSSTSGTSYLTRKSTSDTVYGTTTSYTRTSILNTQYDRRTYKHTYYNTTSSRPTMGYRYTYNVSVTSTGYYRSSYRMSFINVDGKYTACTSFSNGGTQSQEIVTSSGVEGIYAYSRNGNPNIVTYNTYYNIYSQTRIAYWSSYSTSIPYYSSWCTIYYSETMRVYPISGSVTTGTTYLTRESTYDTSYLTCESTSGYSGVSSSFSYSWK